MKDKIINKCDLFASNRLTIGDVFMWDMEYITLAAAAIFATSGIEADAGKLKACDKIIHDNTGFFSEFRGNIKLPILCQMTISEDPEKYFSDLMQIYSLMSRKKFAGNDYLILASMTILDHKGITSFEKYVERTNDIYKEMAKNHPFLTGYEDIPYAAILAVSDISIDRLMDDMEDCYKILKKTFGDWDAVQSLSHVLALQNGSVETKCNKVISIFEKLKNANHKFGTSYELPTLGSLALLDLSDDEIVDLIISADNYLKTKKGFSGLTVGSTERRMFVAQLIASEFSDNSLAANNSVMTTSLVTITTSIEMCLLIASITAAT